LSDLIYGKTATVAVANTDRYGRTLGEIFVGAESACLAMVQDGFAWHYRQYAPKDSRLAAAETLARQDRRGLWADSAPVPPWEFRRPGSSETIRQAPAAGAGSCTSGMVVFNTTSGVYHCIDCPHAKKCAENCVWIPAAEAEKKGRPCKVCRGRCE